MNAMDFAISIILSLSGGAVLLSTLYFRRYQVTRPPIGVFNLRDIAFIMTGIILVPYLYLVLPLWVVAGLLTMSFTTLLYFMWEPVLHVRTRIWLVIISLVGADFWGAFQFGTTSNWFLAINNIVMLFAVIGLSNMWAQSGMRASAVASLAGFLAIYDLIATALLPMTVDMMNRLTGLPFVPMLAWSTGNAGLAIGLGDLLLASVFPLVMRKAFGMGAAITAIFSSLGIVFLLVLFPLAQVFPVMVVLGPCMVIQYAYWARRDGKERTTWQYLQAEPLLKVL